ncbi:MAG: YdcF family protein [Firmicutes bacterium]|nr:YdcF family protein [Bacillota bacterium]
MKKILRDHPIISSILFSIVTGLLALGIFISNGNQYYYRIYSGGNKEISNVYMEQISDDGKEIHLVEQTSIEQKEDCTLIHFKAIKAGKGELLVRYTCKMPMGNKVEYLDGSKLWVTSFKTIFIGNNIYPRNEIFPSYFAITLYSVIMILYFIWRRRMIVKTSMYSYEYMSTWSGQVFFNSIFLVYALVSIFSLLTLKYIDVSLLYSLTGNLYLAITFLTFPVVFLFSLAMTISNISLIRHEGKRITNTLGILTGIGLFTMFLGILILFVLFLRQGRDNAFIAVTYSVCNAFYIIFYSAFSAAIISGIKAGKHTPAFDKDYIIILGCAIKEDGTLYPLIRGRVDRAIEFWKMQQRQTGKIATFVPSGGQGDDEIISEGEAMKRYLLEQGIPEQYILAETKSTTTLENMKFSKELIEAQNPSAKIAFSTTNYHVMRSGILANQAGLQAEGMGAKTKWYFWPNALLREVAGMFAYQPKIQILTLIILGLLAGLTGYLYFLIM